jgi:hypothetical protein
VKAIPKDAARVAPAAGNASREPVATAPKVKSVSSSKPVAHVFLIRLHIWRKIFLTHFVIVAFFIRGQFYKVLVRLFLLGQQNLQAMRRDE